MSRYVWRLLVALLLIAPANVRAQGAPVSLPSTHAFHLQSSINGREYRLFVSLPESYSAGDTIRFPVLYVLDGNDLFPIAAGAQRVLRIFREVEEVIVVGVGYDAQFFMDTFVPRWTDYTPSRDHVADTSFARRFLTGRPNTSLRSGGASDFLRVLREEVIPFVEARFRTNEDRGLWGHSFGGLFALYVLFEQPEVFRRYGISSPSLWWNQRETIAREASYAQKHRSLPARVFLSADEQEGRELFEAFVTSLGSRGHEGLNLTSHVFSGETHASVALGSVARSFRVLYGVAPK